MINIIIATYKSAEEINPLVQEIQRETHSDYRLILTCQKDSAAVNRNYGLDRAESEIVIMIDDDTFGYKCDWEKNLIEPLKDINILAVSARLMGKTFRGQVDYTKPGLVTCQNYDINKPVVEVKYIPTTCVAFRKTDLRFHEGFKGSGFEDTYFFWQLQKRNINGKLVIYNEVKIKHKNEKKNQIEYWIENTNLWNKLTNKAKWHG